MGKKTNLKRGIVVYILGLIITACIIAFFGRNYIQLYFNHEVIIGEVTDRVYPVGKRISVTIFYNFYYNEREINQKSNGLNINTFNIGDPITLLYNPNTNTSSARQHLIDLFFVYLFYTFFFVPVTLLVIIQIIDDIINGNITIKIK